ncbi:MAG: hypothetical protein IJ397_03650 [Lachnospiraceae bacterium]|nr:hypothetical protein [Lachnospiraceae bacterium]
MSRRVSYILEIILALIIYWIGMANVPVLFVNGVRSAAITLGIIGLFFYITNTMGYVMRNPLHPIALIGSIFAIIGAVLLVFQIFGFQFWIFGNPVFALTYFALAMIVKAVLAMFLPLADIY